VRTRVNGSGSEDKEQASVQTPPERPTNPLNQKRRANPLHPSEGRFSRGAGGWLGLAIDFYVIYAKQ